MYGVCAVCMYLCKWQMNRSRGGSVGRVVITTSMGPRWWCVCVVEVHSRFEAKKSPSIGECTLYIVTLDKYKKYTIIV